jgi:hypothetical protein
MLHLAHSSLSTSTQGDQPKLSGIKRLVCWKCVCLVCFAHLRQKENIATIPNILTTSRILLTPCIGYYVVSHEYSWALGLLAVAGFTDMVRMLLLVVVPPPLFLYRYPPAGQHDEKKKTKKEVRPLLLLLPRLL